MFQFLFYPFEFFFIVSGYLLKFSSLFFISLTIVGEVIKGSKQKTDRFQFMNPAQSSVQRVMFCSVFLCFRGGSEQTKVPREDITAFYVTPIWSQGSKNKPFGTH